MSPGKAKITPLEKEVVDKQVQLDLKEAVWCDEHLNGLMTSCLEDFPDDNESELADYAAGIAQGSITDRTQDRHARQVKLLIIFTFTAYIVFHKQHNTKWDLTAVTRQTPYDIRTFITHKCGEKDKGYEGKRFSTAIATHAALSYWYRHCRPNESVTKWRCNKTTEKLKARSGEVSQSACALLREDMHQLNDYCMNATHMPEERRWGVVRYTAYLFAWLMLLQIEEASIGVYVEICLKTRKSAQTGVLHTWRLWANDADPRLCPVQALIRIACLYGSHVPLRGPLFLRIGKFGDILRDQPVSTSILSCALTSDLQGLAYSSWALYGTHSFRQGGCQHRIRNCNFNVSMVAAWGGWSQVEALTMFRYFYSPNDNHEHMVEYDLISIPPDSPPQLLGELTTRRVNISGIPSLIPQVLLTVRDGFDNHPQCYQCWLASTSLLLAPGRSRDSEVFKKVIPVTFESTSEQAIQPLTLHDLALEMHPHLIVHGSAILGAIVFTHMPHCSIFDLLNSVAEVLGTLDALNVKLAAPHH
ncbi:hypothetical protein EV702DRAFT_1190680 [Suillus placidus]|uniref:Uncharacterized protein n=1 Tax=Suillus placidus TaxID=48579 RepID=A0A9P7D820_9AGAM|nr:hypothetical protein EV702DRAFT_1190680 [Suillus placidus]